MADLLDQAFGGPIRTASVAPPIRLVARAQAAAPARDWAVQVGAFRDRGGALAAARAAARQIGGGAAKVEQARLGNRTVWRAQVVGLSEGQARQGCANRQRRRQDCAVVAPAAGTRQAAAATRGWAVRLGLYRDRGGALAAARVAARRAGGGTVQVEQARAGGRTVWAARLAALTEPQARRVCASRPHCAPIAPGAGETRMAALPRDWAVRLGVYRDRAGALAAVKRANAVLASSAPTPKVTRVRFAGRPAWRAEMENLTRAEARRACAAWPSRGPDCVTVAPTAIASAASDRG
jgi:D-alanyl-D-alanine carboxypeptidase